MTALQTVNLGTAPGGSDGDPVRTGFTKLNSNVAVLLAQATLTSATTITTPQALTAAHVGKRVNISLTAANDINLPSAATCGADSVVLLRNIGATGVGLDPATGSGDTVNLDGLNPGESVLMDTDGVHTWRALLRGRANTDNETVNGTLSVGGAYSGPSAAYKGGVTVGGTLGVTGQATFTLRPTFAGKTPWDSGNFTPGNYTPNGGTPSYQAVIAVGANLAAVGGNQGAYLMWNEVAGSGAVSLICNQGSGAGGFIFRTVNTPNTAELGRYTISASGVGSNGSDARLKDDIQGIEGALDKVRRMRGVSYRYKASGEYHYGVIAQEVKPVFPYAVTSLGLHPQDGGAYLGVAYTDLIGPLIEAVKELADRNDALTQRITVLEARA